MPEDPLAAAGLEAWSTIVDRWGLSALEAAALAGLSVVVWAQAREPDWGGTLTREQLLRLSALVGLYQGLHSYFSEPVARTWVIASNEGPLFGGERPVDTMIRGGLPTMLQVRDYVDALLQGM